MSRKRSLAWIDVALCIDIALCVAALSAQPASVERPLGRVDFPTSGKPEAQAHFLRGVAWLHSFGYEDAFEEFEQAWTIDPGFAMAYWGAAMTMTQSVWGTQDLAAGRQVLAALGPSPQVRAAKASTDREKALLGAVEILYGDGEKHDRDVKYAEAMGRMSAVYPDDVEVTCFYALALLGTMHRGDDPDAIDSSTDRRAHALPGSETQAKVAAILQKVFQAHPDHPGAAHYLIHALDDPDHAAQALLAAQAYAKNAPASSHALHMPAHVFLQLGRWEAASESDKSSYDVSVDRANRRGLSIAARDYHSLSWLMYEYLQQGRYRDARSTLDLMGPAVDQTGDAHLKNTQGAMRARYAIETRRWDEMRAQPNYFNVDELDAIGFSAARAGDLERAEMSRQRLADIGASDRVRVIQPLVLIMERQLAGLVALGSGRKDDAVAALNDAVAREEALPPPVGWPQPAKPSHELLGEVLLELGRARESADQFDLAMRRSRNRALSVLGLARAKAKLGDKGGAAATYRTFLENWRHADQDLPELQEARVFTSRTDDGGGLPSSSNRVLLIVIVGILGLAAASVLSLRQRRRSSARSISASGPDRKRAGRQVARPRR